MRGPLTTDPRRDVDLEYIRWHRARWARHLPLSGGRSPRQERVLQVERGAVLASRVERIDTGQAFLDDEEPETLPGR
ncbi:hypothetical protein [Kitasatospora sp. NPDC047058]|uniref:hypothetical protein n=1 Tax=Kitasatospora sp. NPDC047058 TaxID=3155620 RepID=UPI0033E09CE5